MSLRQTKEWWEMLLESKQADKIFEIDWIQIEKRSIWMREYWFFIIWISSIVSFYARWEKIMDKIVELAKKEEVLFVQIETINYEKSIFDELDSDYIEKGYYKKFIMPYTAVIDLNKDEEEILSDMKQKWRYNIRLAEKKWVQVKRVSNTDENVRIFYELINETTSRDNFSGNTLDFYKIFLNKVISSELIFAYKDDKVIAAWIFIFWEKVSIYYYWASTSDKKYRNIMAPYLLQWEAIKIAKSSCSKIYDFLWVAWPLELNSSLSWVTDFKKKLTSDIRKVSFSYIWINKKYKYNLIIFIRFVKRLFT